MIVINHRNLPLIFIGLNALQANIATSTSACLRVLRTLHSSLPLPYQLSSEWCGDRLVDRRRELTPMAGPAGGGGVARKVNYSS